MALTQPQPIFHTDSRVRYWTPTGGPPNDGKPPGPPPTALNKPVKKPKPTPNPPPNSPSRIHHWTSTGYPPNAGKPPTLSRGPIKIPIGLPRPPPTSPSRSYHRTRTGGAIPITPPRWPLPPKGRHAIPTYHFSTTPARPQGPPGSVPPVVGEPIWRVVVATAPVVSRWGDCLSLIVKTESVGEPPAKKKQGDVREMDMGIHVYGSCFSSQYKHANGRPR